MRKLLFTLSLFAITLPALADSVLRVTCSDQDMGAEITVNGEFKGECPLDMKVKAGKLKLELLKPVNEDLERRFTKEMRIGDGVVQKVEVQLEEYYTKARIEKDRQAADKAAKEFVAHQNKMAERGRNFLVTSQLEFAGQSLMPPMPGNGKTFKDCDVCPDMALIPNAQYPAPLYMGDENGKWGHEFKNREFLSEFEPRHDVQMTGFAIAKTEVTQAQWRAVMGSNPSKYKNCGDDCPVENISWNDAQSYVRKLSEMTGKAYRLPSEAEWEYACRAGKYEKYCGSADPDAVAFYIRGNGAVSQSTGRVAQKKPNGWGLYDMSGNVSEWVEDCWHSNYRDHKGAPTDGSAWTTYYQIAGEGWSGSHSCDWRVVRGGDFIFSEFINGNQYRYDTMRAFYRTLGQAKNPGLRTGLRPVRSVEMTEKEIPDYVARACDQRNKQRAAFHHIGKVERIDTAAKFPVVIKLDAPFPITVEDHNKNMRVSSYTIVGKEGVDYVGLAHIPEGVPGFTAYKDANTLAKLAPGDEVYKGLRPSKEACAGTPAYCKMLAETCP